MTWVLAVLTITVGLQWLVIMWMLVTHREEVKRLTNDLIAALEGQLYSKEGVAAPQITWPESVKIPHPNRPGDEIIVYHLGHGDYGPIRPLEPLSGVEEVEGRMTTDA